MKRTLARATVTALAVVGLSMAPAAAAPASHELPGSTVLTHSGIAPGGAVASPNISFCGMMQWFIFCRI